jgi:hypothetical protein
MAVKNQSLKTSKFNKRAALAFAVIFATATDINKDGIVDILDLSTLFSNYTG